MTKKVIALLLGLIMMAGIILTGCTSKTGGADTKDDDALVIWTFSDDTEKMVNNYYKVAYPDSKIKVQVYPLEVFQTRLDGALRTGKNVPDVVALEISFVRKYIESGLLMDLGTLGIVERAKQELYPYTVDIGTGSDGNLYGISNQATPGGFFYRRSIARELWGNDSPEFVQEKLSSWDKFLEVAAELKEHGDKRIVSNLNATQKVFLCERSSGWVKDNKLIIDPCWDVYLEQIRTMQDKMYSNETTEYAAGGGWYTDISGDSVFGYFLAAWGLNYHLKANAVSGDYSSDGDWGVVQGPTAYYNGGTWFAAVKDSDKTEEIKQLLEYFTFNQEYLQAWALETGDFSGNTLTVEAVKDSFADPFLQGQNHYALFSEIAKGITADKITIYDDAIGGIFSELAISYSMRDSGFDTVEDTYKNFKFYINSAYSDIATD